jgi:hypothetical protein
MVYDMTGVDGSYPPNNPNYFEYNNKVRDNNILSAPHPDDSRWGVLNRSIGVFFDMLSKLNQQPRVGLVTWGSRHTMAQYTGGSFDPPLQFYDSTLDYSIRPVGTSTFKKDRAAIEAILRDYGSRTMLGYTNTSAGVAESLKDLNRPDITPYNRKVLVLFTDGVWNRGKNPELLAKEALDESVTIYTITMLTNAGTPAEAAAIENVKRLATKTGGQHFDANSEVELSLAFKEIAGLISTVITE